MQQHVTDIDILNLSFSAGHFSIFSATERENLHGHNYLLDATLTTPVNEAGISFDYRIYRRKIECLCRSLSQIFLLPGECPYLDIVESDEHIYAHFHDEKIPFLKRDIKILPIRNITIEELSRWFVERLVADEDCDRYQIQKIKIKVYTKATQSGSYTWQRVTET